MADAHSTNDSIDEQEITPERFAVPDAINRVQSLGLIAAVVGLIATAIFALTGGDKALTQFFHAYLAAWLMWLGVTLGSLGLLMVQFVARGAWGVTIRRVLEASTKNIFLMALLFIPILYEALFGHHLFPWRHHDVLFATHEPDKHELIQKKSLYLDGGWFAVRFVIYFVILGALAYFINKWSARQDAEYRNDVRSRYYGDMLRNISGPGIVSFALVTTFASVDWVMSLDPEWYSTIFGILFIGAWALSAMAFTIIVIVFLSKHAPMNAVLTKTHFQDLGKLLLALTMLWTYFSVSQLLIIWSGNLPEEIPWFLRRMRGGWGGVSIALVVFQFAVPFTLLLTKITKRNSRLLLMIACLIFFMRMIDNAWLVMPQTFVNHEAGVNTQVPFTGLELVNALAAMIGIGGVWLFFWVRNLKKLPLLPLGDSLLHRALTHGRGHGHH